MNTFQTDFGIATMLDHELGAVSLTPPATWYVGLSTAPALRSGATTYEVSGGGYARVAVTNNATNFPNAYNGRKSNGTAITFPTPSGSWGTVASMFIADAPTGGNVWRVADLAIPWSITTGIPAPSFPAGNLSLSRGGTLTDTFASRLLNFEFGTTALTIPATWYVGLSAAPAARIGNLVNVFGHGQEIVGNGYARVAVTNNLTNFPATSAGLKANGTTITFPSPTGAWGTTDTPAGPVYSYFIADAITGGNVWRHGNIAGGSLAIPKGSAAPSIAIGALTFNHV
jgi:hypothetical protein